MFKNFIKITLRNIATHKTYTVINILGLSIGIAVALLIALYVVHESSYENTIQNSENIYRITIFGKMQGNEIRGAVSPAPLAKTLINEIEGISEVVRVARFGSWLVAHEDVKYNEDNLLFADSNFFKVFSFTLINGNAQTALKNPNSVILTESAVKKYFGSVNPMGKKLKIEDDSTYFTVTGVLQDLPSNTHLKFELLGSLCTYEKYFSYSWIGNSFYTYLIKKESVNPIILEDSINTLVSKYVSKEVEKLMSISYDDFKKDGNYFSYHIQPIKSIHLYSNLDAEIEPNGKAVYVYSFAVIAILILIIACLNFMNLATANSTNRAQEVILRKVLGSEKRFIVLQFLTESVVFSLLGLMGALILAELALPYFNSYLSLKLSFDIFKSWYAISIIISVAVITGIFAGGYPAFFISSFRPVKVLRGDFKSGLRNKKIRRVFVVLQFFVSVLIILLTIIVYSQANHMLSMDLGFTKDNMIVIRRPDALKGKIEAFKAEIRENDEIISCTNSNTIPGRSFTKNTFIFEKEQVVKNLLMHQLFVNFDFSETYGLELIDGRFFSPKVETDSFACVINQSAASILGGNPVGKTLTQPWMYKTDKKEYKIIGVVNDFYFETVDKEIGPLVLNLMPGNWEGFLNVQVEKGKTAKALELLEETWGRYTNYPFVYFHFDKDLDSKYQSIRIMGRILLVFSILAIIIACLGLFGLISYTLSQRTREVGLRKALGSSVLRILLLLMHETIVLVLFSSLLAWIVGYFLLHWWLSDFYNRISINPLYFIWAALIVLVVSVLTVVLQVLKSASIKPGEALRYE